ncbi:MAG: (p)ppGpp synthetase [Lachnospiraceae bacterium]|nr:(p)ppGpp synthetase [Lachnospiraceae bacterium]
MTKLEIKEEELKPFLDRITIEGELKEQVERKLDRIGMYFQIFARVKSPYSLCQKLVKKDEEYRKRGKKLQDLIGIRVVLYYADDIPICQKIIESLFHVRKEDSAVDKLKIDEFKPVRLNLVCDIPDGEEDYIERMPAELWQNYRIDKTFEVQIRTIFSEGWHEVVHDIRYKHSQEWEDPNYYDFNRKLNGINATLEVCDNTIISILESLAYQCYKDGKIVEMFRYKLRIRMKNEEIKQELKTILEGNKELLKKFYRLERNEMLQVLSDPVFSSIPLTLNNIIYICNVLLREDGDAVINEKLPALIKTNIEQWREQQNR